MLLIRDVESRSINIERVGIFHNELPHPQQTRLRTWLVAKLGLNLIPDLRQLLVAAQLLPCDVGHHFFVRHAETQVGALAIFKAKHVFAHYRPASALFPQIARIQRRQVELLADLVHFLPDDAHDLLRGAIPQKEERIDTRAKLAYVSGSNQKFMAWDLGINRGLAER